MLANQSRAELLTGTCSVYVCARATTLNFTHSDLFAIFLNNKCVKSAFIYLSGGFRGSLVSGEEKVKHHAVVCGGECVDRVLQSRGRELYFNPD